MSLQFNFRYTSLVAVLKWPNHISSVFFAAELLYHRLCKCKQVLEVSVGVC